MCRVLVTVQRSEDAAPAVRAVEQRVAAGDCVTVVGVPRTLPVCAHWVGVTGVAYCEGLRGELVDEAERLVRETVAALPDWVGVEHRVALCWRDERLLDRLTRGCVDEVLLVAAPERRRDRRALERAAQAGGVTLVAVEPALAPPAPAASLTPAGVPTGR